MNNTLYNRLNEVADQQAAEGNSWRSFVGHHDQDAKGERVYEKQLYKIRESIVIDIGDYSDHDFHPLLENYDTTKVRRLTKDEVKTEINRGSGEAFEWYVGVEEANEIILEIVSNHINGGERICTKPPFFPRYGQQEAIDEIVYNLDNNGECLFYGLTGIGKTIVSLISACKYLPEGGIVLCTTPIVETISSFISDIENGPRLGAVSQKYSYMTKDTFDIEECLARKSRGEVVFVIISAQDLFYDDNNVNGTIREKYAPLTNNCDLWNRDERHKLYEGDKTSRKLDCINAGAVLDLTATPYNFSSKCVVERSLPWAIKNRDNVGEDEIKIPLPSIECINTHFSKVGKFADLYDPEEGFDPAKLFVRNGKNFTHEAEIIDITRQMYFSRISKKKNHISISNDDNLCYLSKKIGLWVLPPGKTGDSAESYIKDLCDILNDSFKNERTKRYFIPSYDIKGSVKGYINKLSKKCDNITILTCKKFITGTDIPSLGHIALFVNMSSPMEFEQLNGRAMRKYRDENSGLFKDNTKIYSFAPSMSINLAVADIAKNNSRLCDSSVKEYLDCLPLTEYDLDGNVQTISSLDIISQVQDYYRKNTSTQINLTSIRGDIEGIDLDEYIITAHGKSTTSTPVTKDSEAKAFNKTGSIPPTKAPKKADIVNLFKDLCVELVWLSITMKDSTLDDIIDSEPIKKMFSDVDNLEAIKYTLSVCEPLRDRINEFIDFKRMMYNNRNLLEIHDEIFINNKRKKGVQLVYTPVPAVDYLINGDYNGKSVIIHNASSGSMPLEVRRRFPNADITCAEYFPYFKDHLSNLGFKVVNHSECNSMDFDVVIGNPPFDNSDNEDASSKLWTKAWVQCLKLAKKDGIVSLITPTTWIAPTADMRKKIDTYEGDMRLWDTFNRFTSVADVDNIAEHFKGVGSTFGRVFVDKSGTDGLSFVGGYDTQYGFMPSDRNYDIFERLSFDDNLGSKFKMGQDPLNTIKVSIPMTQNFTKDPSKVQILKADEHGTAASSEPRQYLYVYVSNMEEAKSVRQCILDNTDILCSSCRWVGYLNLKVPPLLKYNG